MLRYVAFSLFTWITNEQGSSTSVTIILLQPLFLVLILQYVCVIYCRVKQNIPGHPRYRPQSSRRHYSTSSSTTRKLAIVSGGTGGIGRVIARDLWTEGFDVASSFPSFTNAWPWLPESNPSLVLGRTKEKCERILNEIKTTALQQTKQRTGELEAFPCDLAHTNQLKTTIESIHHHPSFTSHTYVHTLVNCAGTYSSVF